MRVSGCGLCGRTRGESKRGREWWRGGGGEWGGGLRAARWGMKVSLGL